MSVKEMHILSPGHTLKQKNIFGVLWLFYKILYTELSEKNPYILLSTEIKKSPVSTKVSAQTHRIGKNLKEP